MKLLPLFLLSTLALADHECLKKASNTELLTEISARMSGNTEPNPQKAFIDFVCKYEDMTITHTNSQLIITSLLRDLNTASNCQKYQAIFNSKVSNVVSLKRVAFCKYEDITVIALTPQEMKVMSEQDLGTSTACEKEADRINSQL